VIPEIDIWRVATLTFKRYGDKAFEESAARGDELAAEDDYHGQRTWRVTKAVSQLANKCRDDDLYERAKGAAALPVRYGRLAQHNQRDLSF
jgi:hypothetical protein